MKKRTGIHWGSLQKSCFSDNGFLSGFVFCRTEPARLKETNLVGMRFVGNVLGGFLYELDDMRCMSGKSGSSLDLLKDRRGAAYGAFMDPDDMPGTFRYGPVWESVDQYIRAYYDIQALASDLSNLHGATQETVELELACLGVGA